MYQKFFGKRDHLFKANSSPRYFFLAMQGSANRVGETGREFQLDELAPGLPEGIASMREQAASACALLQIPHELLGRSHQMNPVPTTSRERKP
jgi:hypothetical protein